MNKKIKKGLVTAVSAAMSVGIIAPAVVVLAAPTAVPVTRIGGADRYATAAALATANGRKSDNVVLVSGAAAYDAISATALASKLNAPILLTTAGSLNADTAAALTTLGAKTIYVIGGTGSVSQVVRDGLKSAYTLVELGGTDRYATNLDVANYLVNTVKLSASKVLVAGGAGFADALSVAPVAAADGEILLLANSDATSMIATNKFVKDNNSAATVVGTTGVISDTELGALNGATRVNGGINRFATNLNVNEHFAADLTPATVYAANATGTGFADALVGAAAAGVTKSPLVLLDTETSADTANAIAYIKSLAPTAGVEVLGQTGVVTANTFNSIVTAVGGSVNDGTFAVSSVSAIAANQIQVNFTQAPTDATKIMSTVLNGTTSVPVTATWNAAGTIETLTGASNFTSGTYAVDVKNDTVDLGTSTVTITDQKIAKINITSTKLGVVNTTVAGVTSQTGYATYSILDQYGVDITNSALANNVTFQTGVGTTTNKDGLLTITPSSGLNLLTFGNGIVITANDTSTGVSTSATLTATSQIGTLSSIALTTLTNANSKPLTAGDTSDVWYAGFTATDISGNPTTNYTLMKQGLILSSDGNYYLTTSSPYVTAQLVQDPTNSNNGLIEVRATSDAISIDMPVVITAMTWTGVTSQLSTTLKKQSAVDTFTLQQPDASIASGESNVIPFTATDQDGNAITKYSDLNGIVTLTGAQFYENLDGTAEVKNNPVTNSSSTSVPDVISAVTPTGKYSSITVNIQKPVLANTLTLNSTVLKSTLQSALSGKTASETSDFGWNNGGFSVTDQYGRVIDMTTAVASNYEIKATSSDTSVITAGGIQGDTVGDTQTTDGNLTTGNTSIAIAAGAVGSATVRFDLIDKTNPTVVIDSKSEVFTVLADTDIKDYTMDTVPNAIYIDHTGSSALDETSEQGDYAANPGVYGTTSTGGKVVLRGTPVLGATSSSGDFTVYHVNPTVSGLGATKPGDVKLVANTLANAASTGSSTTLTISLLGADGLVHTVSTPVTSSTAAPVAKTMDASVATQLPGIARSEDTVTLTPTGSDTYKSLLGTSLAKYVSTGNEAVGATQNVYFAPVDQYGETSYPLAQITLVSGSSNVNSDFTIANDGTIGYGATAPISGQYFTVSGITNNGLVKTIKIAFGPSTASSTAITAAITEINSAPTAGTVADYTTLGFTQVTSANLTAVNVAVASAKATKGSALLQTEIGTAVSTVATATADQTLLAPLNATTTVATMRAAFEAIDSNLDATVYNELNSYNKNAVAQELLTAMPNAGYASKADLQAALNATTEITAQTATDASVAGSAAALAKAQKATLDAFTAATNASANGIFGGTVDNTAKTITIPVANGVPSGSGIFSDLAGFNVTGITLGTSAIIPISTVQAVQDSAKTAVVTYFTNNALNGSKVTVTVTGANGAVVTVTYTVIVK